MFSSTIIPTIGRPTLSRAVHSVLDQIFERDDYEIIVVNDSGKPLPVETWQSSSRVRVIDTNRRNRSVARNAGAAIARGRYLHFLDDDDWMSSGSFQSFWEMTAVSDAAWIHGAFRMVDNAGETVLELFPDEVGNCLLPVIAWEWLPLQASFIEAKAFFDVGGFAPLASLAGGFEDVDLSRQIACRYDMARIPGIVANIRIGIDGSTTNYEDMFLQNRYSREKTLGHQGIFARMRSSARGNPHAAQYWYGKIVYYYLASVNWHLRRRSYLTALSRAVYALAAFASSGRYTLDPDYWRGVMRPHYPRMGIALQETGADRLYAKS